MCIMHFLFPSSLYNRCKVQSEIICFVGLSSVKVGRQVLLTQSIVMYPLFHTPKYLVDVSNLLTKYIRENYRKRSFFVFFPLLSPKMNEPNDPEQIGDESFSTSFARQRGALFWQRKNTTSVRKLNSLAFPQLEQSDYLFSSF